MTTTFVYPVAETKKATKDFRCSECRAIIKDGSKYTRMNHGRYCLKCAPKFDTRYARVQG